MKERLSLKDLRNKIDGDGGFTININGEPIKRYIIALPNHEVKIYHDNKLDKKLYRFMQTLRGSQFGAWRDNTTNIVYLDESISVDNLDEAMMLGRQYHQLAIYDMLEGKEIRL